MPWKIQTLVTPAPASPSSPILQRPQLARVLVRRRELQHLVIIPLLVQQLLGLLWRHLAGGHHGGFLLLLVLGIVRLALVLRRVLLVSLVFFLVLGLVLLLLVALVLLLILLVLGLLPLRILLVLRLVLILF